MSKVLPANCLAGVVLAGVPPLPLPLATLISKGVGASDGIAVIDEDSAYYLANVAPDLETTLTQVVAALAQVKTALDQVSTALTTLDAKPTGGTGSAVVPTVAANVTAIGVAGAAVDAAKNLLNTLKGVLR